MKTTLRATKVVTKDYFKSLFHSKESTVPLRNYFFFKPEWFSIVGQTLKLLNFTQQSVGYIISQFSHKKYATCVQ